MLYLVNARIFSGTDSGYIAEALDLPVMVRGGTVEEVARNIGEAVARFLEGKDLLELGFAAFPPVVLHYAAELVSI